MKIETVKISIIIAVFNGEKNIEETIKSVLDQKTQIDLIIIDGGSQDKTIEIISKYENSLYKFISEPDNGIYDAFNKGWNLAHPESYILYLGAGDKLIDLPTLDSFEKSDIICGRVLLGESTIYRSKPNFLLRLGNTVHHQALLVKKKLNPVSPFNMKYNLYADFDFNQRLYKKKIKFLYDDKFLSSALPGGVTAEFNKKQSAEIVKNNFGKIYYYLAKIYYRILLVKNKFSF